MTLNIKKLNPMGIKSHVGLIVDLLNLTFTNAKFDEESFIHKHLNSPYGQSICFIACEKSKLVGVRLFARGKLFDGTNFLQAVDTATHPDFRGKGIFKELIRNSLSDPEIKNSLLINFPNKNSLPQYLKYGWDLYHNSDLVFGIIKKPQMLCFKSNAYDYCDEAKLEFIKWRMGIGSDKKEIIRQNSGGFGIVSQTIIKNKKFIRLHGVYGKLNAHEFIKKAYNLYPKSLGVLSMDIDYQCCMIIKKAHIFTLSLKSNFKIAVNGNTSEIKSIRSLDSDVY